MNARRFAIGSWIVTGAMSFIVAIGLAGGYRLNLTGSAPAGLWRVASGPGQVIERGAIVSACPPPLGIVVAMRDHGHLYPGNCPDTQTAPLLKPVVALPGDTVTVALGKPVAVNGVEIPASGAAAGMPAWPPGTYTVYPGEIWLLSSYSTESFDSRYFGPVAIGNLRGRAAPVFVSGEVAAMTKGVADDDRF